MDYQIINQHGNIALVKAGRAYYIVRIDEVGQVFCRVPHPAVAGKALFGQMNGYGLEDVAKALPEFTAFELYDKIIANSSKA